MNPKIIFLAFLLILPVFLFGNTVIAKERAPSNGLYIIGPDISPDSTEHLFLYYSPDGGHTLEVRNRLDWIEFRNIAADYADSIVYVQNTTTTYHSENMGLVFTPRGDGESRANIRAGTFRGYVLTGGGLLSYNYCLSWHRPTVVGWFGDWGGEAELGIIYNIGYILNTDGILFYSENQFDTLEPVYDFSENVRIFRGVQAGELYAEKADTIFYSTDHGNSFTYVGRIPPATEFHKHEIIAGNTTGELFAATYFRNWIEREYVYKGGHLEIWHSTDYGTTWDIVRSYHASVHENVQNVDNPELYQRTGNTIVTSNHTFLFDINGKLVSKGVSYDLSKLKQGLFVLTDGRNSSKIINVK